MFIFFGEFGDKNLLEAKIPLLYTELSYSHSFALVDSFTQMVHSSNKSIYSIQQLKMYLNRISTSRDYLQ